MKRFIAATAFIGLASITSVGAADLPIPVKAPPPPVWSWTGVYGGVNGGYGWGAWPSSSLAAIFPDGVTTKSTPTVQGWFGGLTAGYNWQVSRDWVVGVEGDFDWAGEKASNNATATTKAPAGLATGLCDAHFPCTTTTTTTYADQWQKNWFSTVRARGGFLVDPTWLLYGTGGIAFAGTQFSTNSSTTTTITDSIGQIVNPAPPHSFGAPVTTSAGLSSSYTAVGFAVGAGVEKKVTQNWSVKAEYLFMDFGSHTFLGGTGSATSITMINNVVRIGVNYQFWPNP